MIIPFDDQPALLQLPLVVSPPGWFFYVSLSVFRGERAAVVDRRADGWMIDG